MEINFQNAIFFNNNKSKNLSTIESMEEMSLMNDYVMNKKK